jgi:hypothetical protein
VFATASGERYFNESSCKIGADDAVTVHVKAQNTGTQTNSRRGPAAYAIPAELDHIKWDALEPDQRVDCRVAQQSWLEEDLEIGDQIQRGDYAGMYAGEIIVPGGK